MADDLSRRADELQRLRLQLRRGAAGSGRAVESHLPHGTVPDRAARDLRMCGRRAKRDVPVRRAGRRADGAYRNLLWVCGLRHRACILPRRRTARFHQSEFARVTSAMPAPLLVQHGTRLAMLAVLLSPDLVTAGGSADRRMVRVDPLQPLERVTAFQRLEWRVTLDRSYENPFDPDEIAIDAAFVAPDGRTFVVPAFWMGQSNVTPATVPATPPSPKTPTSFFALRFAPPAAGRWTMKVTATDKAGAVTSADVGFDV